MGYAIAALGAVLLFVVVRMIGPLRAEPTNEELLRDYEADYRDSRYGADEDVK
jgi:hypothetical protein